MTCRDCVHFDVCEFSNDDVYTNAEIMKADCHCFKNKADFVEVVRCEKCKNWSKEKQGAQPFRWCTKLFLYTERTFHCGNGERKDGAGE